MVVSEAIRKEIKEKAELYDAAKEKIKARIEKEINKVLERAKKVGSELLGEVDEEFGKNPFVEFLSYANNRTDADAKRLLDEQKISESFGPDEESFSILQQAIDSLKEWRNFIPKNLKVEGTTWDSITLTWDKIDDASFYQIEVDGSKSWDTSTTNSFTKGGLLPETEHSFRVRAVKESPVSEWSGVVKGRTQKIHIPSNITAKSTAWDSITLTWDEVSGASFYQVEVDGSKSWDTITANTFTKRGLLPETEHSFRVRTVKGSSLSEWSGVVKGRALKKWDCVWKKCPGDVDEYMKYNVDGGNPRIVTKVNDGHLCTILGNTYIPPNAITPWSVKVLESKDNEGGYIYIGIAPIDINQNGGVYNPFKCGWYFNCYHSVLRSGPPHSYSYPGKEYGPRKKDGQYVHTGDSVGVVVDTTKGELSFAVNNVNFGVAYCGIPLDKPLVPCVFLWYQGDSIELII